MVTSQPSDFTRDVLIPEGSAVRVAKKKIRLKSAPEVAAGSALITVKKHYEKLQLFKEHEHTHK